MSTTKETKETKEKSNELRNKLQTKILSKRTGRMTTTQRRNQVDNMCTKMGISEADRKGLEELSNTIMKTKQK
jgi:hypothetical protein